MLQSQSCKITIPEFFLCASRDGRGEEAVQTAAEQDRWERDGEQGPTLLEECPVDLWKIKSFIASLHTCYACLLQMIVFMCLVADTYILKNESFKSVSNCT